MEHHVNENTLSAFEAWLRGEGRSCGTIEKYLRDIQELAPWLNGRELTKETAALWREYLLTGGYVPVTVNSKLAAVNAYCRCMELDIHLKFAKIQRKLFREQSKELTRVEYRRLVETAHNSGAPSQSIAIDSILSRPFERSE